MIYVIFYFEKLAIPVPVTIGQDCLTSDGTILIDALKFWGMISVYLPFGFYSAYGSCSVSCSDGQEVFLGAHTHLGWESTILDFGSYLDLSNPPCVTFCRDDPSPTPSILSTKLRSGLSVFINV
ncbi:hypothetical protein FRC08_006258 [Ceratobasidium sp. 394]|nr:hypothetical protein FRC08_006258 [Ceratobasidium sp. 394]KAG9095944.1 hypothetical protein FS749_009436 [Ceratobasidium sp. UAMH 11750]